MAKQTPQPANDEKFLKAIKEMREDFIVGIKMGNSTDMSNQLVNAFDNILKTNMISPQECGLILSYTSKGEKEKKEMEMFIKRQSSENQKRLRQMVKENDYIHSFLERTFEVFRIKL